MPRKKSKIVKPKKKQSKKSKQKITIKKSSTKKVNKKKNIKKSSTKATQNLLYPQPHQPHQSQIITSSTTLLQNFNSCQNATKPQKYMNAVNAYKSTHYQPINSHLWTNKGKINTSVLDLTSAYDRELYQHMNNLFELIKTHGVKSGFDFIAFRNFLYSPKPSQRTIDYANRMIQTPVNAMIPFHGFLSLSADTSSYSIPKDLKGVAIIIIPKDTLYVCPQELPYVSKEYEILVAPGNLQKVNLSQINGFTPPLGIWKYVK